MPRNIFPVRGFGSVQKSSSSKARANFERGAYWYYVSTHNWRLAYAKPLLAFVAKATSAE